MGGKGSMKTAAMRDYKIANPTKGLGGLSNIINAHMRAASQMPVQMPASLALFVSPVVPQIETHDFLNWLDSKLPCSGECFMLAWILALRSRIPITPRTLHRVMVAALVVAYKSRDDVFYANVAVERATSMPKGSIRELEAAFIHALDWECFVTEDQFAALLSSCLEDERAAEVELVKRGAAIAVPPRKFRNKSFTITRRFAGESVGLLFKDTRVVGVVPSGLCDKAGMERGMAIKTVDGQHVHFQHEVAMAIRMAPETFEIEIHTCEPKLYTKRRTSWYGQHGPMANVANVSPSSASISPSSGSDGASDAMTALSSEQIAMWNAMAATLSPLPHTPSAATLTPRQYSPEQFMTPRAQMQHATPPSATLQPIGRPVY